MSQDERSVSLHALDPGHRDPEFWDRFQRRVSNAAVPMLAARRRQHLTMGGVMIAWSRLVVPLAAAAAAVAATFVVRDAWVTEFEVLAGVEEVIGVPRDGEDPLPWFLHSDEVAGREIVMFAVEDL